MTVSEDAQALYAPRQLLEYVRRGMRFWQYELMDDPDPSGPTGRATSASSPPRASTRRAGDASPRFDTMKDLLAKIADPGPAYEPAPISISVDGPVDLENIVVGRRDGSYQVVAWRDVDVYDPESRRPIDVEPEKVTVTVEGGRSSRSTWPAPPWSCR